MIRITRSFPWKWISPPAGWKKPDLFHKKIHIVNFFVKKNKKYHAAAGEADVRGWHQARTNPTA
jgi:hypothetical protein